MKMIMGIMTTLLVFGIGYTGPNPGTMTRVGGPGGSKSAKAECPSGEFAIAMSYRCGLYINSIQLVCGKLSGGKVVYTRTTNFVGATGGSDQGWGICADSVPSLETAKWTGAITKISARGDVYADYIASLTCTRFDFNVSPPKLKVGDKFSNANRCGNFLGGFPTDAECPSGEVLYKIYVKYGLWIDSWQGYCRTP